SYTPSFDLQGVIDKDLSNQKRLMRADELYKFSDGTLKWSGIIVKLIEEHLLERWIMQNLERLVGARELEIDYRLMQRTVCLCHTQYSSITCPISLSIL
ncbi:hypothetical protein Tco_0440909, partial [Tanacetum coccineum]